MFRHPFRTFVPVILGLWIVTASIAPADEADPGAVDLEVRRVALFKNGLGFYSAAAEVPDGQVEVKFGRLPVPVLGTFWVAYDAGLRVEQFVARRAEREHEVPLLSLLDLLRANAGREVVLATGLEGEQVLRGTLLDLEPEAPDPGDVEPEFRPQIIPTPGPIALQTESGTVFLDPSTVRRVDFGPGDVETVRKVTTREVALHLQLGRPARGEEIAVSYLAKGAAWTPSYLIDLTDPRTAKFHASALIVNEVEDFEDVRLDLVTGFPNIRFADVESPLGKARGIDDLMGALAGGLGIPGAGMASQMVAYDEMASMRQARAPAPSYSSAAEGEVAEDLFLYPVEGFTLAKGETAWRPLFSAEMPYQHIYTWEIADFVDAHSRYTRTETSGQAGEVWHACRLTNTLDQPLTTAATEFVSDGQFVGQDVCHYTAPGEETTIRINKAMNVLVDQIEVEVRRERQAIRINSTNYDLVEVRGELEIENKLDRDILLEVEKELSGEVLETTPVAEDVTMAKGLKRTNEQHRLTWEIELDSGDRTKVVYRYRVYIVS